MPDLRPYGIYLLPDGRRYIVTISGGGHCLHVERRGVGSSPVYVLAADGWVSDAAGRERIYSADALIDTGETYDGG